jgi:hypothetical protein
MIPSKNLNAGKHMKLQRVLSVGKIGDGVSGARLTEHMTGDQRVSLLEDIRRDMAKVCHYEYPKRLRRVLEVAEQKQS